LLNQESRACLQELDWAEDVLECMMVLPVIFVDGSGVPMKNHVQSMRCLLAQSAPSVCILPLHAILYTPAIVYSNFVFSGHRSGGGISPWLHRSAV